MFGFGRGKVELKIDKMNYAPGDKITGKLVMDLKKPIKATKAFVRLYAEAKTTSMSGGKMSTNVSRIYDFVLDLDGAKEYSGQAEYDFEIVIPRGTTLDSSDPTQAMAKTALTAVSFLMGKTHNIKWFLVGGLDIKMGFDFTKKIQLNVA